VTVNTMVECLRTDCNILGDKIIDFRSYGSRQHVYKVVIYLMMISLTQDYIALKGNVTVSKEPKRTCRAVRFQVSVGC